MSADSALAVQAAFYVRLSGDAGLTALLGPGRVYDHVPGGTPPPYVVLGDIASQPLEGRDLMARDVTVAVHVYSRTQGQKEARRILNAVEAALHGAGLILDGHRMVLCLCTGTNVLLSGDGLTREGVARFRVVTEGVPS